MQSGEEDYLGHRRRLRQRLTKQGGQALADYELLEILLYAANPRGDTKPLAKALLKRFQSLGAVLSANAAQLRTVEGLGEAAVAQIMVAAEAAKRLAREEISKRPIISAWERLIAYCRIQLAHEPVEAFHVLFLDSRNQLIADERQQQGTVNHTAVYPREVIKRALELGAASVILVHNHPSGDPTPSRDDIAITREIAEIAVRLGVQVHDHVIIGRKGHTSFKLLGLL